MNINHLIDDLKNEYKYKIDIHAHTNPVSRCSRYLPKDMVDDFISLGYSAFTVTNHFDPHYVDMTPEAAAEEYLNDYHIAKKYGEEKGLTVLLGMELRVTENWNDYLIYGICEEDVPKIHPYLSKPQAEFYKDFKSDRNLILQAHPFRDGMTYTGENIDGIEAYNLHPNHNSRVAIGVNEASGKHFLHTMGTDLHYPENRGLTAIRVRTLPKDSYELAALLKTGDFIFQISDDLVLPRNYKDNQ